MIIDINNTGYNRKKRLNKYSLYVCFFLSSERVSTKPLRTKNKITPDLPAVINFTKNLTRYLKGNSRPMIAVLISSCKACEEI